VSEVCLAVAAALALTPAFDLARETDWPDRRAEACPCCLGRGLADPLLFDGPFDPLTLGIIRRQAENWHTSDAAQSRGKQRVGPFPGTSYRFGQR
jgi:hypothetical protein